MLPGREAERQADKVVVRLCTVAAAAAAARRLDLPPEGEQPDRVRVGPRVAELVHADPGGVGEPGVAAGEGPVAQPDAADDGALLRVGLGIGGKHRTAGSPRWCTSETIFTREFLFILNSYKIQFKWALHRY